MSQGTRLRATVHEFGPILFSRILGLNETQSSLVALIYKFCDDKKLPLLDLKDFKKVLEYITGPAKANVTAEYGLVPDDLADLIRRKLIELEQQGAEQFFGEKSFEIEDLARTDDGFGVLSILRLTDVQDRPKLFSSFLLQMLGELLRHVSRSRRSRQTEAGDLHRRGAPHFRRSGKSAARSDRDGDQTDPLERRRHFFLHANRRPTFRTACSISSG